MMTAMSRNWRAALAVLGAVCLLIATGLVTAQNRAGDSSHRETTANTDLPVAVDNTDIASDSAVLADHPVLLADAGNSRNTIAAPQPPDLQRQIRSNRPRSGSDKEEILEREKIVYPNQGNKAEEHAPGYRHGVGMPDQPIPVQATTHPADMRLDAQRLPDVSDQDLEASKPKPKTAAERIREHRAAMARGENPTTQPTKPVLEGANGAHPAPKPSPANAAGTPGGTTPPPPPARPRGTAPIAQPATPSRPPRSLPPRPTPPASVPPAAPAHAPDAGTAETRPSGIPSENGFSVVSRGGELETQRPDCWYKLPAEERMYFFVWKNTPLNKTLEDMQEMSGLSTIGGIDPGDQALQVTFESIQLQKFDDALTTYNEILSEKGYWVIRAQNYLAVRRLTDWYRYIPPVRMYDSVEAYRTADLPGWEIASVLIAPREISPSLLAAKLVDSIPDNVARATAVPNSNKVELKGFVAYIDRQLEMAKFYDVQTDDGRVLRAYPLRYASPSQAAEKLFELLPPNSPVTTMIQPSARPAASVPRRGTAPVPPQPQPGGTVEIGPSASDEVDIREDGRKSQILVRALESKHKLVAEYLRDYIDVPMEPREQTKIIKLKHGDAEKVIELIRPMLGKLEIYQPPAPAPRPGPDGRPVELPAPPPQVRSTGSTAVLQPMTATNSILVRATEDEMAKIEHLVDFVDVAAPEDSKLQPITVKYASASNICNMLMQGLGGRASRGRTQPGDGGFKAIADSSTDKTMIISGEPDDIRLAKELIAQLDVDPEAGANEHLVFLKHATPSVLAEMLTSRFGGQKSGGGGGYRRHYGGESSSALPKFLADDSTKMLIVMSRDDMWPQIEALIKQVDENSEVAKLTKTYRLKYIDAGNVTSILHQSLGGSRRGGWSGGSDADSVSISYEQQTNAVIVSARDEMHQQVKSLIEELDQPGPSDKASFRAIALTKADADYVARKIQELFEPDGGSGYSYRRGGDSPNKVPVRVIVESVSNQILVSSSEEDFKKAEDLARQIDQEYTAKEVVRRTFELKYAEPSEVSEIIQSTFEARGGSSGSSYGGYSGYRRSRYGYGMSSDGPDLGVKISEIGRAIIVQAPQSKMEEIAEFIAEIDVDQNAGNEIKTYKVKNTEMRGTAELAENLRQLFNAGGSSGRSRYGGGSGGSSTIKFFGDYGSNVLVVSAPSSRMAEIDKTINQMLEAKEGLDLTMSIKHFVIRNTRPQEVADVIEPILNTKYSELQQQSGGGGGRYYSGFFGSSGGPRVTAHRSENKIMITAPGTLMPLAEELIAEFDKPNKPSTTRFVALRTAKAVEIAPIVEEQMSKQGGSSSRRRSSGYGGYGGHGFGGGSDWGSRYSSYSGSRSRSSEADELSVTAVESSNTIILTGDEEKVADAEALIKRLDGDAKPEGMFKVVKLEFADIYEVADMIETMVSGGGSSSGYGSSSYGSGSGYGGTRRTSGSGSGSIMVKTDYQTNQLIIFAPPDKFSIIEEIVHQMEGLAKEVKNLDTGTDGKIVSIGKNGTTKIFEVKGPAKEIAKVLDDALYELFGFSAPYVKASKFTNEIIVTGEPKQFAVVSDLLAKIEKNPPQPKLMMATRRIADPQKVIEQLAQAMPINAQPIIRTGTRRNPMDMMKDREVNFDDPIIHNVNTEQPESPFVPPVSELQAMNQALGSMISLAGADDNQPVQTTDDSQQQTAADRREASNPSPEEETYAQLYKAGSQARESGQAQIRYDPEQGFIIVIGDEAQVKEIQWLMDSIIDELKEIEDVSKAEFKVFKVQYVAVEVAAVILEQMFNDQVQPQQRGKQPSAPRPVSKPGAKSAEKGEGEDEGAGAARRREEEEKQKQDEAQAAQAAAAAGQRIKVIPDPRTNTLIVRAPSDLFPTIAELLLKIDRPGGAPSQKIELFQLKKLNAGEVEQAIRVILKMDNTSMRSGMRRMPMRGGMGAAGSQADMIDQLQEQMLDMQMQAQEQAAAAAAAAASAGQNGQAGGKDAAAGKLRINPSKDIMITSDATTNTIICMASEEGITLIKSLIESLEAVEIPLEIKSFQIANGDAEKLAAELEKVFTPDRGGDRGFRGVGGMSPGRVGGDIKIAADNRTNTIVVRALKPDMEKITPLIKSLDITEQQVQIYPVNAGNAKDLADTLSKMFGADGGRDGARSTRITADEGTNSLLVYAPNEARQLMIAQKIKELDGMVGEASKPKQIELKFADALAVANTLKDVFVQKGAGNRAGKQQVSFVGDANSGIVFVTAPEELFKQIQKVTMDLDQPTKQDVQVFTLKHATASEVAKNFQALMQQMMVTMKGAQGASKGVAITPDDRTNSLVVVGSPAEFMVVNAVLERLDIAPTDVTAQTVGFFKVSGGQAETRAASVNALYANQKFPGGVLPPKAVASGKDMLYVYGTQEQIRQVKASLIDPAEAEISATMGTVQDYALDLKHAKADEVAQKLKDWFKNRDAVNAKAGITLPASDASISIQADTQAKKLFVYCSAVNKKIIDDLLLQLDTPEMADTMQHEVLPVRYTEAILAFNALNGVMANSNRPAGERPVLSVEPNTSTIVAKATRDDMAKIKELLEQIDKPGGGGRQTFTIELKYADTDDVATTLTNIYASNRSVGATRSQASFNVLQGTRKILVTTTVGEFENIKSMVEQLDLPETEKSRDMRVVQVTRIAPAEMGQMLTEYLRKPGRSGRADPSLLGDVRIVASNAASSVVLTGPSDRLDELEQLIAKVDAANPGKDKTGRQVAVIPLNNANPYAVAAAIGVAFGNKRGSVAEADLVDVAAEPTTNTLVVTAMPEKLERVRETISKLDENSANKPQQEVVKLQYAPAEDMAQVLTATYVATRGTGAGPKIAVTADSNANSLVISAGKADIEAIKSMVEQLDKRATDSMQEMRVMPLEYIDATETATLFTEYLRKPGRSGQRGGSNNLIGDIKIQPSVAMNALIVSGAPADLDDIQKKVQGMDKEMKGAGTAPRIIKVEHGSASQLAQTLTQMFTDPATRQRSGRAAAPDMVPLIMADETSGTLLVRAKTIDYNMIEEMVKKLDVPQTVSNTRVVKISRGIDVATLARQIEDTINKGEMAKQAQRRDYRPGRVSIGFDERTPALLVAGSPELIPQVESLVMQLDHMRGYDNGLQQTVFIPLRSVAPNEIREVLNNVIKQQTGRTK